MPGRYRMWDNLEDHGSRSQLISVSTEQQTKYQQGARGHFSYAAKDCKQRSILHLDLENLGYIVQNE